MPGFFETVMTRPAARSPFDDFFYSDAPRPTAAGVAVTPEGALRISAVWACVSLISDTIASLPLPTYERVGEMQRKRATDQATYRILHDRPNAWQTALEFRQFMTVCALLRGDGFARKVDDGGELGALWPLHPDTVGIERVGRDELRYRLRRSGQPDEVLLADEVFHLRGLSLDGIRGVSVVEYARQGFGLHLAAEAHGARFFGAGQRPGGILAPSGSALTKEQLDRFKAEWRGVFDDPNNVTKTAILPADVRYTPLSITNDDAQFLETREFQLREIARWFRVPLHMIGEMGRDSNFGTGIESQVLGFVVFCLRPWLVRWEQAISRDLIVDDDRFYAEHVIEGLLRGDTKTRFESYQLARQNGVINAAWWAEKENWPVPEGEAGTMYWRPLNMTDSTAEASAPAGPGRPPNAPPSGPEPPADDSGPPSSPPSRPPGSSSEPATLARVGHYALLLEDAAARIVRREIAALGRLATRAATTDAWATGVDDFYAEHAAFVAAALHVPPSVAGAYADEVASAVKRHGAAAVEEWEEPSTWRKRLAYLTALAA